MMFVLLLRKCYEDDRYYAIYKIKLIGKTSGKRRWREIERGEPEELERDTNESLLRHRLDYWWDHEEKREVMENVAKS